MYEGKYAILLIEDSDTAREIIKDGLEDKGYLVRLAAGTEDIDAKIGADASFMSGLDLMICDMELREEVKKSGATKDSDPMGEQARGSQIGMIFSMAYDIPFIIYSGKEYKEIKDDLMYLEEECENNPQLKKNYRGFVPKKEGVGALVKKVGEELGIKTKNI